jgi:hypothetical protein
MLLRRWAAFAVVLTLTLVATTAAQLAASSWAPNGLGMSGPAVGNGEKSARPIGPSLNTEATSISVPGWREPTIVRGSEVELDPKALVVGIRMNGQARAYMVPTARANEDILIRDTVGDQEISVGFSGHGDQVVVLKWLPDGRRTRYPFHVVSWRKWLTNHPGTDVAVAAPSVAGIARPNTAPSV